MTSARLLSLSEAHIPQILDACTDWEELAQHGPPYWRPRSEAELRRKVAATAGPQPASEYNFVVQIPDGTLVGECSLHAIDWRNGVAQVGVCIWRPVDRQKGHGRFGIQQMGAWGFSHLGLHRLEAWVLAGNEASSGLFKSLGYACEGSLSQRYLCGGERKDVDVLALLAAC